jgi:anaerobic ribonucleoside-triphosphate reductase activating protein
MHMVLNNLNDICVAGITPFTTIDFPGRLAGVFYLQGCPWRCRYCCNPEFWPLAAKIVPLEKILQFLDSRKGHLDGIVFSGGEPTIHEQLPVWMKAVKDMGYKIGLHTGGIFPERLEKVLPLCDWVGLDIKAHFDLYEKVTQIKGSGEAACRSAELLLASGVAYEFRTTVHPILLSESEILEMVRELVAMGCRHYVLQMFRPDHCSDKKLSESGFRSIEISSGLRAVLKTMVDDFRIRDYELAR